MFKPKLCEIQISVAIQELIQNAEDAGATEIKFLLDHTKYGGDPNKLINPDLAQFQVYWQLFTYLIYFIIVSK